MSSMTRQMRRRIVRKDLPHPRHACVCRKCGGCKRQTAAAAAIPTITYSANWPVAFRT